MDERASSCGRDGDSFFLALGVVRKGVEEGGDWRRGRVRNMNGRRECGAARAGPQFIPNPLEQVEQDDGRRDLSSTVFALLEGRTYRSGSRPTSPPALLDVGKPRHGSFASPKSSRDSWKRVEDHYQVAALIQCGSSEQFHAAWDLMSQLLHWDMARR